MSLEHPSGSLSTRQVAHGFSNTLLQEHLSKVVDTPSLMGTFAIVYNLNTSQPLHSVNITGYVSLLWALPVRQFDCRVTIFPWAGSPLMVAPQGRDVLPTANLWMSPSGPQLKLQLDCTAGNSPLEQGCLSRFEISYPRLKAFLNQGREALCLQQILGKWVIAELSLRKHH